jgi:hypothetical protein
MAIDEARTRKLWHSQWVACSTCSMPPLWLVALTLAAAAPFCAAALQAALESRLRSRTQATIARALSMLDAQKPGEAETGVPERPEEAN